MITYLQNFLFLIHLITDLLTYLLLIITSLTFTTHLTYLQTYLRTGSIAYLLAYLFVNYLLSIFQHNSILIFLYFIRSSTKTRPLNLEKLQSETYIFYNFTFVETRSQFNLVIIVMLWFTMVIDISRPKNNGFSMHWLLILMVKPLEQNIILKNFQKYFILIQRSDKFANK